jgi:hypothetical protein
MLDTLPPEVLLIISENLSIRDLMAVRCANKTLHQSTTMISEYVVSHELQKYDFPLTKIDIYEQITFLMDDTIEKTQKYYRNMTYASAKQHIRDNILQYRLSINPHVNTMFQNLFRYYLDHNTIYDIQSPYTPYTLFIFYNLYQIDVLYNIKNINYNIRFLNDFYRFSKRGKVSLHTTLYNYYFYILSNRFPINIESLYIISEYMVTMHSLKKLFGIKYLNLKNTQLITAQDENVNNMIYAVVLYKYNLPKDHFLSQNYMKIKSFLKRSESPLLSIFTECEFSFINSHIVFKHPYNQHQLRLNSRSSQRFLYQLKYEKPPDNNHLRVMSKLDKFIRKRQTELLAYYFDSRLA